MKLNKTLGDMVSNNSELRERIQKTILVETDQRQFVRQGQGAKEKNEDWITKLKQQNRRLKDLRDDIVTKRRTMTVMQTSGEVHDQNYYKRQLDKLKFLSKTKKNVVRGLQNKINDQDQKNSMEDDNPVVRNIRIMENKLDKIMIKYNEAIAMKDTYEHIVKRLKEERVGYDNQLTAIQRSLKGKEHDFEQLLLLAHDAAHAKDNAQAELKKFQHKRTAVKDLREKFLHEKKEDVDKSRIQILDQKSQKLNASAIDNSKINDYSQLTGDEDTEQQLAYYQQAFRKLKEVSGVNDANEIIQKFRTQTQTNKSMEDLSESYKIKIENLKNEISQRKSRLNEKTARGNNKGQERRMVDQMEMNADKIKSDCEKVKAKCQKTNKLLVNARAGVEHLLSNFGFIKTEKPIVAGKLPFDQLLSQTFEKLNQCFSEVASSPSFNIKYLEEQYPLSQPKQKTQKLNISKKIEASRESSDYQFDEQLEASTKKPKVKPERSNQLQSLLSSSGSTKVRRSSKRM